MTLWPRAGGWLYVHLRGDVETLAHRLHRPGFLRIERMEHKSSLDAELARDRDLHAPYALYVDAVR